MLPNRCHELMIVPRTVCCDPTHVGEVADHARREGERAPPRRPRLDTRQLLVEPLADRPGQADVVLGRRAVRGGGVVPLLPDGARPVGDHVTEARVVGARGDRKRDVVAVVLGDRLVDVGRPHETRRDVVVVWGDVLDQLAEYGLLMAGRDDREDQRHGVRQLGVRRVGVGVGVEVLRGESGGDRVRQLRVLGGVRGLAEHLRHVREQPAVDQVEQRLEVDVRRADRRQPVVTP